jgi:hypothetical protein
MFQTCTSIMRLLTRTKWRRTFLELVHLVMHLSNEFMDFWCCQWKGSTLLWNVALLRHILNVLGSISNHIKIIVFLDVTTFSPVHTRIYRCFRGMSFVHIQCRSHIGYRDWSHSWYSSVPPGMRSGNTLEQITTTSSLQFVIHPFDAA